MMLMEFTIETLFQVDEEYSLLGKLGRVTECFARKL